jgi:ubiquinone/menaquinone biosynthesis C-methylase UbiE
MSDQRDRVLDQFTRQAEPFSKAAPVTDETALRPVLEATGAGPADDVLDVACGPGIVVCAFARIVRMPRESISPRP